MTRRLSRRQFLIGLGAAGGVAATGYGTTVWSRDGHRVDHQSRLTRDSTNSRRTLVLVELRGGNDSLNMVVPHSDPRYRELRPTLGITNPIDLDGDIGLSPKLPTLAAQYRAGHVAIVEGVGVLNGDLSHFASLQRWWTGDPSLEQRTGWLGRYLDRAVGSGDPLAGVAIGPGPSPMLAGATSFSTAITNSDGLQPAHLNGDIRAALLRDWATLVPPTPDTNLVGYVQHAIAETLDARTRLARDLPPVPETTTGSGKTGTLAPALTLAARLAASPDPPRIIHVHVEGDFDTHQGETERHPLLMADLDAGINAFVTTLAHLGASDQVVLATMSEFGRRPQENGAGTDHGTAAAHFVLGPSVRGGRHGEPPSLTRLDPAGNLITTTEYRSYDATLLGWLDPTADAAAILGDHVNTLPIF